MDYLFTPWRYQYITSAGKTPGCLFCEVLRSNEDRKNYVVYRGKENLVMLNAFPYTSGHVMIAPYTHVDELRKMASSGATEMILLTQKIESAIRELYSPDGMNIGMNLGRAAGAGVAGHVHMHALPRWSGDSNFMGAIGETRILPESLDITYERYKQVIAKW